LMAIKPVHSLFDYNPTASFAVACCRLLRARADGDRNGKRVCMTKAACMTSAAHGASLLVAVRKQ